MMSKFRLIAIAAACLAATSAQALTPAQIDAARAVGTLKEVRIAGATALRLAIGAYAQSVCDAASFNVYFNDANGANNRAYACNLGQAIGNFAVGTPVLIYKRDQGGSGQGVNPLALGTPQPFMNVSAATCVATANPTPSADILAPSFTCAPTLSIAADAGISDEEPRLFQATINLPAGAAAVNVGLLNSAPVVQGIFGLAVNKKLYRALQEAQGIIAPGASLRDVPNDQDLWTAADIATIPTLSSQFVRSALSGQVLGNATAKRGWNIVIPPSVDAGAAGKTINICRRTEGSGTQAGSNAFFLNNPCAAGSGGATNPLGVAGSSGNFTQLTTNTTPSLPPLRVQGAPLVVIEATGTGDVERCLGNTVANANSVEAASDGDGIGYGLGVISRENNPRPTVNGVVLDRGYRFVKIDGAEPTRAAAQRGDYGFVFESTFQWPNSLADADKVAFLSTLRSNIGAAAQLNRVDVDVQQGVMAAPTTYVGAWADLTGVDAKFGSRVARLPGNSCSPLRVVK